MTTAPERTATLSALVAAEIRATLGRQDVRASELARRLGENDQWLSTRLKGRTPINLNDIQRIADALDIPILQLMPAAIRRGQSRPAGSGEQGSDLNASLRHFAEADPEPSPEPPRRHIATRPFSPPRRDPSRPVSAIPATKRRPGPVRPGNRLMTVRA